MRHLLLLAVCLAACGLALADFTAEIELYKENLPTQAELELLKTVSPANKNAYYPLSWAVQTGSLYEYWFDVDVWPDDLADTVRVEMDTPDQTLTFFFDGESFYLERGYFNIADLQADFPPGLYSIWVQSSDNNWQSRDFILPPYTDDDFPALVDGQLTWQNNLLRLNFDSVENADDLYTVTAYNLANEASLWQGSVTLTHPQSAAADFGNRLRRGRYDSRIDVEAQALLDDSDGVEIWMIGAQKWWSLRKPLPVLKDEITKCTVTAGAKNIGNLVLSGQLQAIEADFRNADTVLITLAADAMPQGQISLPISINDPAPKRAAYTFNYKDPAGSAAAQFRYNVNTRAFSLTARGLDLTGLACPFTITITIGNYYRAEFTLEETLVNGAKKSLSPLFVRGLADTLTVERYKFTPGKAYNLDTFTAQGTFTYAATPDPAHNDFVLTFGAQQFRIDGGVFNLKNGVYACKDALLPNDGRLTARLDTIKSTYSIALKNVFLETDGLTPFGIDVFGADLTGLAAVNLGRIYTYWELTGYDRDAARWQYKSRFGTTISVVDSGNGIFDVMEIEPAARTVLTFQKAPNDTMAFRGLQLDGSDPDVKLIIDNINLVMNPPSVRPRFVWFASSLFDGQLIVPGRNYEMLNQSMQATIALSPKATVVKVPAGTFTTIPFTETWTTNAIVRSNNFDAGIASFVFTQTSYSAPEVGIVKRTRKVTLKLTLFGDGAYSRSASDTYQLLP